MPMTFFVLRVVDQRLRLAAPATSVSHIVQSRRAWRRGVDGVAALLKDHRARRGAERLAGDGHPVRAVKRRLLRRARRQCVLIALRLWLLLLRGQAEGGPDEADDNRRETRAQSHGSILRLRLPVRFPRSAGFPPSLKLRRTTVAWRRWSGPPADWRYRDFSTAFRRLP